MRVCLINPPSAFLLDDKVFPPLGVLRVAGALEERGIPVTVCDLSGKTELIVPEATHYGITATTAQIPAAYKILKLLPKEAKVVLGGAHATMAATAAKRGSVRGEALLKKLLKDFGCVVSGDGERAVFDALAKGAGLIDADDPSSGHYVREQDLAPLPSRHLIDLSSYSYTIEGKKATSIVTQLGCPFGCAFCGGRYSPFYRRVRLRSVDSIMKEISVLYGQGYRGFMFLDDELNVSPDMLNLMEALSIYEGELSLRGFVKASIFKPEHAKAMRKAGFSEVLFGFESGDDRILRNMQKGSVSDNTRALKLARDSGLRVKALMSIGHPGESKESVFKTSEWLLSMQPDDFDVTIITPYPGTPYWDDAVFEVGKWTYTAKGGDRLHQRDIDYERDDSFYKGVPGNYVSQVHTDFLKEEDLVRLRDLMEQEVRDLLSIPYPARSLDHSMGQSA